MGWAITPIDLTACNKLIASANKLTGILGATKIEGAAKWYTYVVENCPRNLPDYKGGYLDYEIAICNEAKVQTTLDLISWRVLQYDDPKTMPNRILILFFIKLAKYQF